MVALGSQLRQGFAKQTTAGTAQTTLAVTQEVAENSIQLQNEFQDYNLGYGNVASAFSRKLAKSPAGGSISFPADVSLIGHWLLQVFRGGITTTGTTPKTHKFICANVVSFNNPLTWFQQENEAQNIAYYGGIVDKMTIEIDGQMVKVSVDLLFRGKTTSTAQTYTLGSDVGYLLAKMVSIKYASTVAGLSSGTVPTCLRKIKIELSNNAKVDLDCLNGSVDAGRAMQYEWKPTVSFTMDYDSTTLYNWLADPENNKNAWQIDFTIDANNKLVFTVQASAPKLTVSKPINDIVSADITLDQIPVLIDGADTYDVRAVLTNNVASY